MYIYITLFDISYFYQHADIDECASGPCQNGGTCTDQVNGYLCQCAPGYSDLQCQTGINFVFASVFRDLDIDDCASGPSENGCTCIDQCVSVHLNIQTWRYNVFLCKSP